MKKCILLSFVLPVAFLVNIASAENTYTAGDDYYLIKEISPFSIADPVASAFAGMTQIKFSSTINWLGGSGCSTSAVVLREEDKHLLSVVMLAFSANKPIRLFTDNTQLVGSSNCILRALTLRQ